MVQSGVDLAGSSVDRVGVARCDFDVAPTDQAGERGRGDASALCDPSLSGGGGKFDRGPEVWRPEAYVLHALAVLVTELVESYVARSGDLQKFPGLAGRA
jgi:hypothetical protein